MKFAAGIIVEYPFLIPLFVSCNFLTPKEGTAWVGSKLDSPAVPLRHPNLPEWQ